MQSASMTVEKIHILRVDPGEDVLLSTRKFLDETHLRQAIVMGGYGTLAAYHLHWVAHNHIPVDNIFERGEGGIEILAMNGLVVEGEPHIHVALATQSGAFGGHLEEGCIAYVLCEIFFARVAGIGLTRKHVSVAVQGMGEGDILRLMFGGAYPVNG